MTTPTPCESCARERVWRRTDAGGLAAVCLHCESVQSVRASVATLPPGLAPRRYRRKARAVGKPRVRARFCPGCLAWLPLRVPGQTKRGAPREWCSQKCKKRMWVAAKRQRERERAA